MARRTLEAMVGGVQRRLNGYTVALGEIVEALAVANKELHAKWDWPWTYQEYIIPVPANYTTGSINLTNGSATITGNGTSWDTTWINKSLMTGANSMAYIVTSVNSPTSITVAQPVNIQSNQSNAGYIIYQDRYPMPANFEPGADLLLSQPSLRNRLIRLPRYTLEQQAIVLVQFFSNIPTGFADYGYDSTQGRYLVKIIPPPGGVAELRLFYRAMAPDLTTPAQTSIIPESFDDTLEWMALARIAATYALPVAQTSDAIATKKLKDLRRKIGATLVENTVGSHGGSIAQGSMSQWGLSVYPQS